MFLAFIRVTAEKAKHEDAIEGSASTRLHCWRHRCLLAGKEEGSALASFIPLYISLVVPVFLFDLVVKNSQGRARTVLAAAVIAPFASLLSGGRPLYLLIQIRPLIPILIVPIVVAGAIAGLSGIRFADALLRQQPVTAMQTR